MKEEENANSKSKLRIDKRISNISKSKFSPMVSLLKTKEKLNTPSIKKDIASEANVSNLDMKSKLTNTMDAGNNYLLTTSKPDTTKENTLKLTKYSNFDKVDDYLPNINVDDKEYLFSNKSNYTGIYKAGYWSKTQFKTKLKRYLKDELEFKKNIDTLEEAQEYIASQLFSKQILLSDAKNESDKEMFNKEIIYLNDQLEEKKNNRDNLISTLNIIINERNKCIADARSRSQMTISTERLIENYSSQLSKLEINRKVVHAISVPSRGRNSLPQNPLFSAA